MNLLERRRELMSMGSTPRIKLLETITLDGETSKKIYFPDHNLVSILYLDIDITFSTADYLYINAGPDSGTVLAYSQSTTHVVAHPTVVSCKAQTIDENTHTSVVACRGMNSLQANARPGSSYIGLRGYSSHEMTGTVKVWGVSL